jgi:hypothetical protein
MYPRNNGSTQELRLSLKVSLLTQYFNFSAGGLTAAAEVVSGRFVNRDLPPLSVTKISWGAPTESSNR